MNQSETIVIEPGKGIKHYWLDIWRYGELFLFLAWRDILVRYKQTVLGVAWSVIRPLLTMIILTLVFGKLARLSSGGVPYPLLVFTGLLPWQFFSNSVTDASNSLIQNSNMITKIYFPRFILPGTSIIINLIDFIIVFSMQILLMVWYRFVPGWHVVFLPFFVVMAGATALGIGLWLSALNVKYRDFRYVVPFFIQFGLYISPVGLSSDLIPDKWRILYSLNPMVGVIDGFRWSLLGGDLFLPGFAISIILIAGFLYSGFWYFRRTERYFADMI